MVVDQQAPRIILILMLLLVFLTKETSSSSAVAIAKPGCLDNCGGIPIPYPFGIGPNCSADESYYSITCDNSSTPVHRPILNIINLFSLDNFTSLELIEISVKLGTVRVQSPIITYNCPNRQDGKQQPNLFGTPFRFSANYNRFTSMGCNNLALITRLDGVVIGGCVSNCNEESIDASTSSSSSSSIVSRCIGINCCQTTIPPSLQYLNVSLESIAPRNVTRDPCKYTFIVEQEWFYNLTDIDAAFDQNWFINWTDPYAVVRDRENVPAVLEWATFHNCTSFTGLFRGNSSLCSTNASCRNQSSSIYLCVCDEGYAGNPYLSDGCQDIDECATPDKYCGWMTSCVNWPGNYSCYCPSGYGSMGNGPYGSMRNGPYGPYGCYKMKNKDKMIVTGICSGIGVLVLLIGMWWLWKILKRRKKNKLKQKFFKRNGGLLLQQQLSSGEGNVEKTKVFTSKELEKATDNYDQNRILGQGGQGTVFKGMLTDGRIVAIKKSRIMDEGQLEQFVNEVVILSQISHRNIVKIFGCCLETEVPLLVYEFIPNGTLFEYIQEENEEFPLSWNKRVQIATEVAGALSYLHSAASIPIYHRDIKSSNILLDEKYKAKVADFGTSRSLAIDQTHLTTRVMGTFGYLDPEYFQSSQFTEKSDVYSFGVVLLELLTGQTAISSTISEEGRSLATQFILTMKDNRLYDILDARVLEEGGKHEIMAVANLAKRCLNLNGRKRPTMKEVTMELEGIRVSQGASITQKNHEELEYEVAELNGPWDVTSTSTGSYIETGGSKSIDVQPLLLK